MEKQKAKTGPKKKVGKKQRRKRKLILFIVEVLVILILLVVFYVMSKLNKINNTGSLDAKKLNINIDSETQEVLDNYTNIAIFGIDNRNSGNYESGNSDCIMIASINDDTKEVKLVSVYRDSFLAVDGKDSLRKLNAAYAKGEASNMHIWIDEMNEVMGTHGKPVSGPGVQQVNGIQALAYCRDRMSGGDDFRRTERQRIVVGKIVEKAKQADILTLNDLVDKLFPDISTSLSTTEILGLAAHVKEYELADTQGWPFQLDTKMMEKSIGAVVVPTDLETNVDLLHRYLFDVEDYETTDKVKEISKAVSSRTGKTAADTTRDTNPLVQDAAAAETTE